MFIPTGMRYSSTARGSVNKLVKCARCNGEFVYQLAREAEGAGRSVLFLDNQGGKERAYWSAQQQLHQMLEDDCDPVPCPDCGYLQPPMVKLLRKRHRRWLGILGLVWLGLSVFVWFFNLLAGDDPFIPWPIFWPLASLGLVMLVMRFLMRMQFDPNTPQEMTERKSQQNQRAMRRNEFEEWWTKQQAAAAQTATPPALPN